VTAPQPAPTPIPAGERLRWSLSLVAELVDLSANKIRELIRKDEFPPRVAVDGKEQFVPDEVRAWAAGRDWRTLVADRLKVEESNAT
jgi:predicted DNA-binding transcriptional regulator AlpA